MKLYTLFVIGLALSMTGCERKEQATPEQAGEAQMTAPAAEPLATEEPAADKKSYEYVGFLRHMHAHADQVDLINIALSDDDLDATKSPARWLSRHDTVSGIPVDWQPYLFSMREAARAVESAADLDTARAASKRITEQCQACHTAAGIVSIGTGQEDD